MPNSVEIAVQKLNQGDIVAIPTETVYGLAARIDKPAAIEKIFHSKRRPFFDPLIVHVSNIKQAQTLTTSWNYICQKLAETFWPGPLTLVLTKSDAVSDLITSGLDTVGIRLPNHPIALEIIEKCQTPLAAPSANLFGRTSPTTALHVQSEFVHNPVFVVDGGPCQIGIESTVLSVSASNELTILRPGAIHKEQISKALQAANLEHSWVESSAKNASPGQMKHHYMPNKPLIYCKRMPNTQELSGWLSRQFQQIPDEVEGVQIVKMTSYQRPAELILNTNAEIAARELYSQLRQLSLSSCDYLYFVEQSYHLLPEWAGIMDRLRKASTLVYT